ncbi:MAG: hypothetical protein J0653_08105, partial [Deltaproteobacteria bacterium]|nr:hypothetical protein [Deltaproteobacteria bacterium]
VRGESAAQVIHLAELAQRSGGVTGHPYPTEYDITDPLHFPSEMAVVLGNYWILPPDLAAAYPQVETDDLITEIDDDGTERPSGFEPLY